MLAMRPEQMESLAAAAVGEFEGRMLAHIEEYFPAHSAILGEEPLRATIRLGIERGQAHGFTAERDLHYTIPLMLLLGSFFEEDPLLPWVGAVLGDAKTPDPSQRAERLYDEAMAYLDAVMGEDGELLRGALERLVDRPLTERWEARSRHVEGQVVALLREVWPEKAGYVRPGVLVEVAQGAVAAARTHEVSGDLGPPLCGLFALLLGSGFAADPQFPWLTGILADRSAEGRPTKAARLHDAGTAFAGQWLARA